MTHFNNHGGEEMHMSNQGRLAYIKPTSAGEARRLGILPDGIRIPDSMKLYVVHAMDGTVLGYTDAYDTAYGAAVQNDLMPVSVH